MLFKFLNYLQPVHYFQLPKSDGTFVFPAISALPKTILNQFEIDENYSTQTAKEYDLSWRILHSGYIGNTETYKSFETVENVDEYRFIRKYFSKFWVFYVLVLRFVSFRNPAEDLKNWYRTRTVKRVFVEDYPIEYENWPEFSSPMIQKLPKVSVVIPTLNRYTHLKNVLKDLEVQTYKNFEVIIVDQSEPYQPQFYDDFNLDIQLIRQTEKALWLARNTAIKAANGNYIGLSEDDVRIHPDWIEVHLKCLDFFKADVSAGVFYPLNKSLPKARSYFAIASQFATGNAILNRDVFEELGLFDRQFEGQRMGDGEFGMRAYLQGIKSVSNPFAACVDVKANSGGLRLMGSWDAFRPTSLFAPRPIPSVLYFYRKYFGRKRAKLALLKTIPSSIMPYTFKNNKLMMFLGVIVSIVIFPFILFQIYRSWRLSNIKLREGAMISTIQ